MVWSGAYAIASNTGIAYNRASGIGIALENNPWVDELNVRRANTGLAVLTRGVVRVTGAVSSLQTVS